jgi:putative dehydrogenase
MDLTVGIVGVGTMGLPIAGNLVDSGFRVVGYRRSAMPAEFLAIGGEPVGSPAELAERSDVVLTILPTDDALRQVVGGPQGLVGGAHHGLVVAELSTLSIEGKTACADQLAERGVPMLDCPISGMPAMVAARTAALFCSGDKDAYDRALPVLEGFAGSVEYLGGFGMGTKTKFVSYCLLAIHTMAAAESMVLAKKAGLDLDALYRVINNSIAGSTVYARRAPMMISGTYTPAPGPVDTLHEGLEQVREFASSIQCPLPLTELAYDYYTRAQRAGRGQEDIAVMFSVLGRDASLDV